MKAILFDFDYTLVDSSEAIVHCFFSASDALGLARKSSEAIKKQIGMPLGDMFRTLYEDLEDLVEDFKLLYVAEADKVATKMTYFYPDAAEMLMKLKQNNYLIGIVSTKNRSRIEETLSAYDMAAFFDLVIGGEDVKEHKPSPEGILKAMDLLDVEREHVVYIGDSLFDLHAAANADVQFLAVLNGMTDSSTFLSHGIKEYQLCLDLYSILEKLG